MPEHSQAFKAFNLTEIGALADTVEREGWVYDQASADCIYPEIKKDRGERNRVAKEDHVSSFAKGQQLIQRMVRERSSGNGCDVGPGEDSFGLGGI